MIFPRPQGGSTQGPRQPETVHLQHGHVILPEALSRSLFGEAAQVYTWLRPQAGLLVIGKPDHPLLGQEPSAQLRLCKHRSTRGDRAVDIRELCLDHSLPEDAATLRYEPRPQAGTLVIYL